MMKLNRVPTAQGKRAPGGAATARRNLPRFQKEAMAANARFVATLEKIAAAHGITKAQLALAWVLALQLGYELS